MPLAVQTDPTPLRTDEDGVVRIGNTRVMLERVVYAFDDGASAEEIAARFPALTLADVHASLAYILRHRAAIDAYMKEVEAKAADAHRMMEERSPQQGLRDELKRRLSQHRDA